MTITFYQTSDYRIFQVWISQITDLQDSWEWDRCRRGTRDSARFYGPDIALKALPTAKAAPPLARTSALAPQQRLDCPASQPASRNQLTTITAGSCYHGSSNATLFRRVDPFLFILHFFFLPLSFSIQHKLVSLYAYYNCICPVSLRGQRYPMASRAARYTRQQSSFVIVEDKTLLGRR